MDREDKKIYVVGSQGYIGTRLMRFLQKKYNVFGIDLNGAHKIDLKIPQNFDYNLLKDATVIFTAAVSSPDLCANDYENAYSINVVGTKYFITEALKRNCKILFFSSDAVFGFTENIVDELTPTVGDTAYGKMKKEIEDAFKKNYLFKAIRLSYVFSFEDKFTSYLLSAIRKNEVAEVFHPFYRNVITVDDVINVIDWLLQHWEEYEPSFLNVCGSELVSRVRIADEVKRCTRKKLQYSIRYPGKEFYRNRPEILEMKSLYLHQILNTRECFSDKIKKQWEKENNNE